jgi:hypothetical protein
MGTVVIGDEGSLGRQGWLVGAPVVQIAPAMASRRRAVRVSTRPMRLDDGLQAVSAWPRSVMSAPTASALPPAASIVVTSVSRRSLCRRMTATLAPCSASFLAGGRTDAAARTGDDRDGPGQG